MVARFEGFEGLKLVAELTEPQADFPSTNSSPSEASAIETDLEFEDPLYAN